MGITAALANANSGLSVASRRAGVVSNNVANALTPGFAKRTAQISQNVFAGAGAGVSFDGVTRAIDPVLTRSRRIADSTLIRDQTVAATYSNFNNVLGEPGDPFSLFTQYQNFESSLRSLSQTPESNSLQAQVLDAANALTSTFRQLAANAVSTRQNADVEIANQVDVVNNLLKEVEKLNSEISVASNSRQDATGLEDQRKILIDQISEIIPVKEIRMPSGKINLITDEGAYLISGSARQLSFTPTNNIGPAMTFAGGTLSGLTLDGADLTPSGGGTFEIKQGALAGLFTVRDEIAPEFQMKIDGLARDVIERFEGIDPTLSPGDPGLFTDAGAAFNPATETGLSSRIAINAAVDPAQGGAVWRLRDGIGAVTQGASGSATIILTLLDSLTALRTPPSGTGLTGSLSAVAAAADVTSSIGRSRISAESQLASTAARSRLLTDAEQSATAVDTDFELQQLLLIEQAYSANARVIQIADDMMRRLMEL
jgi:flagellar hook-associated protein 1